MVSGNHYHFTYLLTTFCGLSSELTACLLMKVPTRRELRGFAQTEDEGETKEKNGPRGFIGPVLCKKAKSGASKISKISENLEFFAVALSPKVPKTNLLLFKVIFSASEYGVLFLIYGTTSPKSANTRKSREWKCDSPLPRLQSLRGWQNRSEKSSITSLFFL